MNISDFLEDVFTSWFFSHEIEIRSQQCNGMKYFMTSRSYFNAHEFWYIYESCRCTVKLLSHQKLSGIHHLLFGTQNFSEK